MNAVEQLNLKVDQLITLASAEAEQQAEFRGVVKTELKYHTKGIDENKKAVAKVAEETSLWRLIQRHPKLVSGVLAIIIAAGGATALVG